MNTVLPELFSKCGYKELGVNTPGIMFFVKNSGSEIISSALIETEVVSLSSDLINNIKTSVCNTFNSISEENIHLLFLLISDRRVNTSEIFTGNECFWIIDTGEKRLMQFEINDPVFDELIPPINTLLENTSDAEAALEKQSYKNSFSEISGYIRTVPVTLILIILNFAVFFFTDMLSAGNEAWLYKGCLSWERIADFHEYYRIFTAMFLHMGIDHISGNMLSLLMIGAPLERAVGHGPYLVIYLVSGICGNLTSAMYSEYINSNSISVGASGAVFGVMGAVLFMVLYTRGRMEGMSFTQIVIIVFINLYYGLTTEGIDNSAHIGGLLSGFVLCALLELLFHMSEKHGRRRRKRKYRKYISK